MRKSVAILVSNPFRPDPRVRKEARSLACAGYDVTILAWDRECNFPVKETIDGVTVNRIRLKSSFGQGIRQIGPFLLFWWCVVFKCLRMTCDVVHCCDLDTLIPGLVVARLRRARVVFDAFECYPLFFSARFPVLLHTVVQKALHLLERFLCLFVDEMITVSDYLADHYRRFGKPVAILYNCPPKTFMEGHSGKRLTEAGFAGRRRIAHVGGMNRIRGLPEILGCLSLLKGEFGDVLFLNIGDVFGSREYVKSVWALVEERDLCDHFEVTGWVDPVTVPRYLAGAAAGLILFQPLSHNAIIGLPNKLFEYMAAGVSVVASDFPSIRKVVTEEKCGLLVDPTDPEDIARAIIYLFNNPEEARAMGMNGRRAVEQKYNWDTMEKRLLEVYQDL